MSDVVLKVEALGKKYTIGHQTNGERYSTLRETLARNVGNLWKKTGDFIQGRPIIPGNKIEEVWALNEVSFEVRRGETIGIIGRNGAGKSTLLKILSRITEPSAGRVTIKGRVSSLLEVGVGFHPELTGRENIYLNGAIFGMTRAEIRARFDAIVEFAEIHRFLDTPVKRYSSGMYVRLAFAVAAHLEPEILLVDEVLAVGDFAFQKKCLGKMEDAASEGRTILLVSHHMEAILKMCGRCILLENGTTKLFGPSNEIIGHYLNALATRNVTPLCERSDRTGSGELRFLETWIESENGQTIMCAQAGQAIKIVALYEAEPGASVKDLQVAIAINTWSNIPVTDLCNHFSGDYFQGVVPRQGRVECVLPKLTLNKGSYTYNLEAITGTNRLVDHIDNAGRIEVEAADFFGTGKIPDERRLILMEQKWQLITQA